MVIVGVWLVMEGGMEVVTVVGGCVECRDRWSEGTETDWEWSELEAA